MDPRTETQTPLSAHLTPFKSRLLRVGQDGYEDFDLIRELHPTEGAVFERAIVDFARRKADEPDAADNARHYLGLTLIPWIQVFTELTGDETAEDDWITFRTFTRPWARRQLACCCAATVATMVADYHRSMKQPVIDPAEEQWLQELERQIEQFSKRSDAQPIVTRLKAQRRDLLDSIQNSVVRISPSSARGFTYLLNRTSRGAITNTATAAIILRGNDSPTSQVLRNPLQMLDVSDVGAIYGLTSRSLTNKVSKLRNQAMKSEELGYFVAASRPQQLWQRFAPPKETKLNMKGEVQ